MSVDLSELPPPSIIEELDFETIRDAWLAYYVSLDPELADPLPSDPAYRLIETGAYREMLLRQRINDSTRAVLPPTSWGDNLDNIVTRAGITGRLKGETDEQLLVRFLAAWSRQSTAGAREAYRTHALEAHAQVKDVAVTNPAPEQVLVTVLSTEGDGTPSQEVLDAVEAALSAEKVRPLNDVVTVQAATIEHYSIVAELTVADGPDAEVVRQAAEDAAQSYADARHRLNANVRVPLVYGALAVAGVEDIDLSLTSDTLTSETEAPYADSIIVTVASG